MDKRTIFVLLASLFAISLARPDGAMYTTKYDNIDLQEILHSERLLKNYYNCLIGEGNCPPDGAELKETLPDALKNGCKPCSEKQKEGSKVVVNYIMEHKPDWYKKLEEMYDPTGEYRKNGAEQARKEGFNI